MLWPHQHTIGAGLICIKGFDTMLLAGLTHDLVANPLAMLLHMPKSLLQSDTLKGKYYWLQCWAFHEELLHRIDDSFLPAYKTNLILWALWGWLT